jgi:hypothetical protein
MNKRSRGASVAGSATVVTTDAVDPLVSVEIDPQVATLPAVVAVVSNQNVALCPPSPASNRERFRSAQMPSQVLASLDL